MCTAKNCIYLYWCPSYPAQCLAYNRWSVYPAQCLAYNRWSINVCRSGLNYAWVLSHLQWIRTFHKLLQQLLFSMITGFFCNSKGLSCCIFSNQNAYSLPPFSLSICISHYLCLLAYCLGWRCRIHEFPNETLMLWTYDNHISELHYSSSSRIISHKILEL